jgi:hypothetical protein
LVPVEVTFGPLEDLWRLLSVPLEAITGPLEVTFGPLEDLWRSLLVPLDVGRKAIKNWSDFWSQFRTYRVPSSNLHTPKFGGSSRVSSISE